MKKLEGKTCLITAAAQGIGRACAEAMLKEGARVIATDVNAKILKEIDGVEHHVLDVTDREAIAALVEEIGAVHVLFNCAGFVHDGTILDSKEDEWDFAFRLNAKGAYLMIKAFLPLMLKNGGGSIINMSSIVSSVKGAPNRCVYGASKAAIIGLTKSVAVDFVKQGIRCNAVCPATVDSPSLHDRLRATGDYDKALKAFIARQPLGRLATPEEIAALVVYLASDDAAFVTGQAHVIDGGWAT